MYLSSVLKALCAVITVANAQAGLSTRSTQWKKSGTAYTEQIVYTSSFSVETRTLAGEAVPTTKTYKWLPMTTISGAFSSSDPVDVPERTAIQGVSDSQGASTSQDASNSQDAAASQAAPALQNPTASSDTTIFSVYQITTSVGQDVKASETSTPLLTLTSGSTYSVPPAYTESCSPNIPETDKRGK